MDHYAVLSLKEESSSSVPEVGMYRGKVCVVAAENEDYAYAAADAIYATTPHLNEFGAKKIYAFSESAWKRNSVWSAGEVLEDDEECRERYAVALLKSDAILPGKELQLNLIYDMLVAVVEATSRKDALEKAKEIIGEEFYLTGETRAHILKESEWPQPVVRSSTAL